MTQAERKAALILTAIAVSESAAVLGMTRADVGALLRFAGFSPGKFGALAGWVAAAVVFLLFVRASVRLPSVRANLWRPSGLKLLAIAVAVSAGMLEEIVFRKLVMDAAMHRELDDVLQVLLSALSFGVAHGVWGLFGRSARAAIGATLATAALGAGLAIVYLLAGRSLAPCIVAHFAIDLLIEPGLVLAATRGEMTSRTALRA